jgi:hypothetical protein
VNLPAPRPGLVIRYSYLWAREAEEGRDEGVKDRPCAIVLVMLDEGGRALRRSAGRARNTLKNLGG